MAEILAGKQAFDMTKQLLPRETLDALKKYRVSIKGPLTTPIGSGHKSLNVLIRQNLDLYACVRPIRYFPGTSSPMVDSSLTDMIVLEKIQKIFILGLSGKLTQMALRKLLNSLSRN